MQIPVIALCGESAHGKSTVAEFLTSLASLSGARAHTVNFGDPLKRALQMIYGFTEEQMWGEEKETPSHIPVGSAYAQAESQVLAEGPLLVPRETLLWLGDGARQFSADVWIRHWLDVATQLERNPIANTYSRTKGVVPTYIPGTTGLLICADLRYVNEAKALRQKYGSSLRIWRVEREGAPERPPEWASHVSEVRHKVIFADATLRAGDKRSLFASAAREFEHTLPHVEAFRDHWRIG